MKEKSTRSRIILHFSICAFESQDWTHLPFNGWTIWAAEHQFNHKCSFPWWWVVWMYGIGSITVQGQFWKKHSCWIKSSRSRRQEVSECPATYTTWRDWWTMNLERLHSRIRNLIARLWSIVASSIIGYADYDKDYSGFITFLLRKDAYRCEVVKLSGAS